MSTGLLQKVPLLFSAKCVTVVFGPFSSLLTARLWDKSASDLHTVYIVSSWWPMRRARLMRRAPSWCDGRGDVRPAKATCARRLWSYLRRTCFSRACRRAASVAPGIPTDTDSAGRSPFFQLQTLEKCTSHSWLSNYNFSPVFLLSKGRKPVRLSHIYFMQS